jgi:hypothetical protein
MFATQPAFLDLWSESRSLNLLLHAPGRSIEEWGCLLGSARIPAKLSHHLPVENIKRLVLRHFNWKKGSAVNFRPIDRLTVQKLRPDEIYLHGYYCNKKLYIGPNDDPNNPFDKFLAAILFLPKLFGSTDRVIASLCMDKCWSGYGFETWVSYNHWCTELVSTRIGRDWKLVHKERLGNKGIKLIYSIKIGGGNDEALVRTVTFEMILLVLDEFDGCLERGL